MRPLRSLGLKRAWVAIIFGFQLQAAETQAGAPQQQPAAMVNPFVEEAYTAYLDRADRALGRRDYNAAVADFSKVLQLAPNSAQVYRKRAMAERAIDDDKGAIQDEVNADYLTFGLRLAKIGPSVGCPSIRSSTKAKTNSAAPDETKSYRTYLGCESRPRNEIVILNLIGVRAKSVDGSALFNVPLHGKGKPDEYLQNNTILELLPGRHTIEFVLPVTRRGGTLFEAMPAGIHSEILFEAGKTYLALERSEITGRKTVNQAGPPADEKQPWVEISDQKKDPLEYVRLYENYLVNHDKANALSALESSLALFPKNPGAKEVRDKARQLRTELTRVQEEAYRNGLRDDTGNGRTAVADLPELESSQATTCISTLPVPGTIGVTSETGPAPERSVSLDLKTVLSRAKQYVEEYEAKLGNVTSEEIYVQRANWSKAFLTMMPTPRNKQQRTESHFTIMQVGKEWIGVREVNCLDGIAVEHKGPDLLKALDGSPETFLKAIDDINLKSASYNIGDIERTTNLPTFALRIMREGNFERFEFKKSGEANVGRSRTWAVGFREVKGPSMIHDLSNSDEFAEGTLWIEPETGRILKTEIVLSRKGVSSLQARTTVSYEQSAKLGMLVPSSLLEHYATNYGHTLDCRADYLNFRRFEVETHFDFGSRRPPPDR